MSSSPVPFVRSTSDTVNYAFYRTMFSVEKALRGELFYPNIIDPILLNSIRLTADSYKDKDRIEGLKTQKTVERLAKEGKMMKVDSVLYDFHQFLFEIVEEAKIEGSRLRRKDDEVVVEKKEDTVAKNGHQMDELISMMTAMKVEMENKMHEMLQELKKLESAQEEIKKAQKVADTEYCRLKAMEAQLIKKDDELDQLNDTIIWYKKDGQVREANWVRRMEEKDEEMSRLWKMIHEIKWKRYLENEENKKTENELRNASDYFEGLLIQYIRSYRKELEEAKDRELKLIKQIKEKEGEMETLKKRVKEEEEKNMEDDELLEKLADSEEEVYKLNEEVVHLNKKMEMMSDSFEKLTREMAQKQKETESELEGVKKELKEAKDELDSIYEEDEADMANFY
uniref:Dynein regulatory complex protein 10 n=1 Tax=Caenorhabditis tropicalis TaxID=1561998 RepID=A0A1I7TPD0_9PELO